ncbi:peptidase M24 [Striga asiatica]|uniref:Peptidase M24 n=1 Tax=Striga asiatica TaxID=4170 RepID=A0A5A7PV57_STRAF|nr:peptidase M24 [Striga asiatica]
MISNDFKSLERRERERLVNKCSISFRIIKRASGLHTAIRSEPHLFTLEIKHDPKALLLSIPEYAWPVRDPRKGKAVRPLLIQRNQAIGLRQFHKCPSLELQRHSRDFIPLSYTVTRVEKLRHRRVRRDQILVLFLESVPHGIVHPLTQPAYRRARIHNHLLLGRGLRQPHGLASHRDPDQPDCVERDHILASAFHQRRVDGVH